MTKLSPCVRVGYALEGITSGIYGTVPGLILMPFSPTTSALLLGSPGVMRDKHAPSWAASWIAERFGRLSQ